MPSRAETLREVTAELQKKISRPAFARRIGLITGERIVVRVTIEGTPYYTERQPRLRDWRVILEDPTILSHHRRVLVELRDGGNRASNRAISQKSSRSIRRPTRSWRVSTQCAEHKDAQSVCVGSRGARILEIRGSGGITQ